MNEPLSELNRLAVNAASEKKATDILVLDLRNRSDLTDFFLICSGKTHVQVQAIADAILEATVGTPHKVVSVEGYNSGNWVILDLVDIIVHIFKKDVRKYYDLERLWGDVPIVAEVNG
ncbi:MAG: ribosome silencing factor [Candidatus Nitronauta litoralis]|uniref:Ribosomal silencing factor RsfS n=1 Tax=Candidatus Nitronauta litoralis TaxID=2705533 RepID=A0A7T0G0A4_9BACT|nr:MAG: ribosome silencing factor [Candidatus Nitronauta litoralis]